jgi:aryl-alcohol dehydrogenase-like predicted oxidoreductase
METIEIAGTGLKPSRIGLGTWAIGGWMWGGSAEQDAIDTIHAAIERGITLIDTAPVYGFGRSEEIVGKALADGGRRRRVVLATKCGIGWDAEEKPFRDGSRARIVREIEDSLRRLGTDVIDIYQVHWPDLETPFEETAQAMQTLLAQGKIRAIGVSNYSPEQMAAFRAAAQLHTEQPLYNLFERGIEHDVLPYCRQHGISTVTYGALCRGLLSGRMSAETRFQGDDLRRLDPKFRAPRFARYLAAVDRLDRFARERWGKRVIHLALRWLLDRPGLGVALWGARRPAQLDPLGEVMGWHLDEAAIAEIDRIVAECVPEPIGPEFMAPPLQRPQTRGNANA